MSFEIDRPVHFIPQVGYVKENHSTMTAYSVSNVTNGGNKSCVDGAYTGYQHDTTSAYSSNPMYQIATPYPEMITTTSPQSRKMNEMYQQRELLSPLPTNSSIDMLQLDPSNPDSLAWKQEPNPPWIHQHHDDIFSTPRSLSSSPPPTLPPCNCINMVQQYNTTYSELPANNKVVHKHPKRSRYQKYPYQRTSISDPPYDPSLISSLSSSSSSSSSLSDDYQPHSTPTHSTETTPRRYKCTVCVKRFTRPSSLATHMHSHTGEKPYRCNVEGCGRRFSVVSNLRRHAKIHTHSMARKIDLAL